MINERATDMDEFDIAGIDVEPIKDGVQFVVHTYDLETDEYTGFEFEFTKPKFKGVK